MKRFFNIFNKGSVKLAIIVLACLLGVFVVYRLSFYLAPFIIAFALSSAIEPVIRLLTKSTKLPRKIAAPAVLMIFIIILGIILILIILKLIDEIKSFSRGLPGFFSQLYENLNTLFTQADEIYEWLPEEVTENIETVIVNMTNSLMGVVNSMVNTIVKGAYTTAISIPEALIFTLVTILSTYFLASDRDRIARYFRSQFPDRWVDKAVSIKNDMFSALFGYLKTQLILISITFTELFIGFSIIRIKYALLLAFLVSMVDALPILGTGTILIPWSIYEFLTGNIRLGVSIIVIYGIVLVVRQMIEPRILGYHIGIYPLLTLIAMYAGLKLFGVVGLILGPITLLLLKNILRGIFKNKSVKEIVDSPKPPE
jgi:sporulation integral membrane protein YtvI